MTPAQRYHSGEWENEAGWVLLDDPLTVDLWSVPRPKLRAKTRHWLGQATIVHTVTRDLLCSPWFVHLRVLLAVHKRRFSDFDENAYLDFIIRSGERAMLTFYIVEDLPQAVSVNFAYPVEKLVVAQLFAWRQGPEVLAARLGATDFLLQARRFADLGFRAYALGESMKYKRDLFTDAARIQ